ncbi:Arabinan endo-1,5-alpha-L-arabinanase [Penicillium ucsense]|uniref:Arabinan endo-1,5-alpha-L-arabinosidase n=1 Tax=Penicillium ucsense TaxID=2839758 RepID=A0A8J8W9Y4_9EURO|nr:Arabinan endo-1,5-alpha-L-arabinanase [Penicillium ucsense]KAF7734677.1 Arabinan endo-1,5-alpha-L-arabinanase [Penicillium ucsense]
MLAIFLCFLLSAVTSAYPARGPCTGDCWTHDPSMIRRESDGTYFRFSTGTGVNTMMSPSLQGPWVDVGRAMPNGSIIHVDGVDSNDIWAPDVHYQDGLYYMYYVLSKLGTQTSEIGVATSSTMEPGSWTDHGIVGIPANNAYNRIDPNWITINGQQYLQFGSYWQGLYQVALQSPLHVGSDAPHQLALNSSLNHRIEAPFLYQHDEYYYLFYSGGIAGSYTATYPVQGEEYRIDVCRSTSGTGGFVDQTDKSCLESGGTLILASHDQVYAPGGQGVLNDRDLGPILYYHYYSLAAKQSGGTGIDGYLYGWNELDFSTGWPVVKAV